MLIALLTLMMAAGANASAQVKQTRWGIALIAVPIWEFPDWLARAGEFEETLRGSEYGIGIVRARPGGGDWGLSVVNKNVSDGARIRRATVCVDGPADTPLCARETSQVLRAVSVLTVQVHKHWTLFRIGGVQFGLAGALGAAHTTGNVEEYTEHLEVIGGAVMVGTEVRTTSVENAIMEGAPAVLPIVGLEASITGHVSTLLRLKIGSGINLPGLRLPSVTVQYLF